MNLENRSQGLTQVEKELYQKCISRNPGLTEQDWKELRESYVGGDLGKFKGVAKLFEFNGIILGEEKPDLETKKEMNMKNIS